MTAMRGIASIERTNSKPTRQVLNLSAAAAAGAGTSSGSGSGSGFGTGTSSSTDTSAGCPIAAALRQQRLRSDMQEGSNEATSQPTSPPSATRMYMERDTIGEPSMANLKPSATGGAVNFGAGAPVDAGNNTARKRASGVSQLSDGAMSLELPVFRKGRRAEIDEWDDDDDGASDVSSIDDGVSSDGGGGGAWDSTLR